MADDRDVVAGYRYVSFTTFRRTGEPVSVPVWIAQADGDLLVISEAATGKVKRLGRDPRVELRPCTIRGAVEPGAPVHHGTATVRDDDLTIARTRAALGGKYRSAWFFNGVQQVLGRLGWSRMGSVALVVRLDEG